MAGGAHLCPKLPASAACTHVSELCTILMVFKEGMDRSGTYKMKRTGERDEAHET